MARSKQWLAPSAYYTNETGPASQRLDGLRWKSGLRPLYRSLGNGQNHTADSTPIVLRGISGFCGRKIYDRSDKRQSGIVLDNCPEF